MWWTVGKQPRSPLILAKVLNLLVTMGCALISISGKMFDKIYIADQ